MLSYILGMAFRFEREHGYSPNLIYLNQEHIGRLYAELGASVMARFSERLGMAVMISPGIVHPQVIHLNLPRSAVGH